MSRYIVDMIQILTLSATLAAVTAQAQVQKIETPCGLDEGKQYTFKYHKQVEVESDLIKDAHSLLRITLITEGDGTLTVKTTLNMNTLELNPEQLERLNLTEEDLQSEVTFILDDRLNTIGLRDWETVRDRTIEQTGRILEAMIPAGMLDDATAEQLKSKTADMFVDEQAALEVYANRINPYFLGYGWELNAATPIEKMVNVANPIGGHDLPAYSTMELRDNPKTPDTIEYRYTQVLHPLKANAAMRETLAEQGLAKDEIERALAGLQLDDTFGWQYNAESGVIERADFVRISRMPGGAVTGTVISWELVIESE